MIRGRVVSFDRVKGYGFVAPDAGGEDVFIHVNDMHCDKGLLTTGSIVEFRLDEGVRGRKASDITVVQSAPEPSEHEITEALLRVEPELTSRQIRSIRMRMLRILNFQAEGASERE